MYADFEGALRAEYERLLEDRSKLQAAEVEAGREEYRAREEAARARKRQTAAADAYAAAVRALGEWDRGDKGTRLSYVRSLLEMETEGGGQ